MCISGGLYIEAKSLEDRLLLLLLLSRPEIPPASASKKSLGGWRETKRGGKEKGVKVSNLSGEGGKGRIEEEEEGLRSIYGESR